MTDLRSPWFPGAGTAGVPQTSRAPQIALSHTHTHTPRAPRPPGSERCFSALAISKGPKPHRRAFLAMKHFISLADSDKIEIFFFFFFLAAFIYIT